MRNPVRRRYLFELRSVEPLFLRIARYSMELVVVRRMLGNCKVFYQISQSESVRSLLGELRGIRELKSVRM